jgi:hypothetical protein
VLTKHSGPVFRRGELLEEDFLLGLTPLPQQQDLLKLLSWILSQRRFDLLEEQPYFRRPCAGSTLEGSLELFFKSGRILRVPRRLTPSSPK